jgi:hypothetical protein
LRITTAVTLIVTVSGSFRLIIFRIFEKVLFIFMLPTGNVVPYARPACKKPVGGSITFGPPAELITSIPSKAVHLTEIGYIVLSMNLISIYMLSLRQFLMLILFTEIKRKKNLYIHVVYCDEI